MNILAIETSCDETAAAVVQDGQDILSSVVSSQITTHRQTGGIVPEVGARLQMQTVLPVIEQALVKAFVPKDSSRVRSGTSSWAQVDAIAVTFGPGLIGSLMVGLETAKTLAYVYHKPLIPVNHLAGHVYACLHGAACEFPYVALIVSGGHTELAWMEDHHRFKLIGSTRDDAAGEAFDKVARMLSLPYPGGPPLSRLAQRGNPDAIAFPRPMLQQNNYDFSFSGLKSAVRREINAAKLTKKRQADLAASFQAAVVEVLVAKTVAAAAAYHPTAVLLGGGVAANQRLRQELQAKLAVVGTTLRLSPPELTTDNAAMIGLAAFWQTTRPADPRRVTADPGAELAAASPA